MKTKSRVNFSNEEHRGIGKSTARILMVIAEALNCPRIWIAFIDHDGPRSDPERLEMQKRSIEGKIKALNLKMDVAIHKKTVYVRSRVLPHLEMRRLRMERYPEGYGGTEESKQEYLEWYESLVSERLDR